MFSYLMIATASLVVLYFVVYGIPERKFPLPKDIDRVPMIKGGEPWFYKGRGKDAVIVCHGYQDAPFNTKPLGKYLNRLGYTTIGIRLPGHGTSPEELAKTRFYHWASALEESYLDAVQKYRRVYLAGLSLGGTLALTVAAKHHATRPPDAVITISSPLFFNGFYNGSLQFHKPLLLFTGLFKCIKRVAYFPANAISKKENPINPWVGYERVFALSALHSFHRSLGQVRKDIKKIRSPLLNIMCNQDRTVSIENQSYMLRECSSPFKTAVAFDLPIDEGTMHPLITHKLGAPCIFSAVEHFLSILDKSTKQTTPNPIRVKRKSS